MKGFTFGILLYNQERMVLDLLESIKYQKLQFGNEWSVSLVVTDDASTDHSVKVVQKWIDKNRGLFAYVRIMTTSQNKGTVYQFQRMIKEISDRHFKVIASDDVLSANNVFNACGEEPNTIYTYVPYMLVDGRVVIKKELFGLHVSRVDKVRSRRYHEVMEELFNYFYTPCAFYQSDLLQYYHIEELPKLRLFEDDPLWHSILHYNKDAQVKFCNECKVLYRMHGASATASFSVDGNSSFKKDYQRYKKWLRDHEKNILCKIYLNHDMRVERSKYFRLPSYIYITVYLFWNIGCSILRKYRNLYEDAKREQASLQGYYDTICMRANEFYDKFISESN